MVAVRSGSSTPCCSRPCPASSSDSSRRKCRHAWRFSLGGFWGVSEWSHWNSQSLSYPDRKARESALALACLWVDLRPLEALRQRPSAGAALGLLCAAFRFLPFELYRSHFQARGGGGEAHTSQPKERRPRLFSAWITFSEFRGRSIAFLGGFIPCEGPRYQPPCL